MYDALYPDGFLNLFILLLGISYSVLVSYSHETRIVPSDTGWEQIRVWTFMSLQFVFWKGEVQFAAFFFSCQ